MVRIRLKKIGSKGKATYKIIVTDQRKPRNGKYLEEVGTYNPHSNPAQVDLSRDRISDWINKGAQPSESVFKLFHIAGFDDNGKIKPLLLN
ncbi:30S ribosomal protein S16, partial [Dehalococcoidia bacterium]|nr:30S ribosomal protein S16 [Dehalococcoidia bacterium]MDC0960761.1 30S ribosomal protein S16 [Dehalococcoidia bacterium]